MDTDDLPQNSIGLVIQLTDNGSSFELDFGVNLDDDLDPGTSLFMIDLLNGLNMKLKEGVEDICFIGKLGRHLYMAREEMGENSAVEFTPADELLDAIEEEDEYAFDIVKEVLH